MEKTSDSARTTRWVLRDSFRRAIDYSTINIRDDEKGLIKKVRVSFYVISSQEGRQFWKSDPKAQLTYNAANIV